MSGKAPRELPKGDVGQLALRRDLCHHAAPSELLTGIVGEEVCLDFAVGVQRAVGGGDAIPQLGEVQVMAFVLPGVLSRKERVLNMQASRSHEPKSHARES